MGIFRQFPYTNFHEINLDWLLNEMKKITADWIRYNTTWDDWKTNTDQKFEELQKYVEDYFDNLDIKTEIVNQFNILMDVGYFDDIIAQLVLKKENINCNLVGSGFNNYDDNPAFINVLVSDCE